MSVAFARRAEHARLRALGVSLVGLLGAVHRQRAPLAVCQLSLFKLSHAAVPACVQREVRRHAIDFLPEPSNGVVDRTVDPRDRDPLPALLLLGVLAQLAEDHLHAELRQPGQHLFCLSIEANHPVLGLFF
ncbi:hypothetical protein AS156_40145 [Bradyrhizobium macuxiense]|uniref:Uncharacterized protein n=1 Tax=Bradyrhizobium macuxiense TaxID=1755647 RepID=A0A109JY47_9BRAD|nr:hypothetical protein AS156_40145 [Bradyrhizobium macuxiense]